MSIERGAEKVKIGFIERKFEGLFSLEKVFRQVAARIPGERFEVVFQKAQFGAGLYGIIRNLLFFKPAKADIYHVTGDVTYLTLALPPSKTVLTIHDLSILRYRKGIRRFVLRKLLFDLPARRARYVTVISSATKADLLKHTGCDPGKISLIENPVDESLDGAAGKPPFNRDRPNILQVGTLPYKNLPSVIRALEGIPCTLTIIGELSDEIIRLLEAKNIAYRNETGLDNDAMKEKYRTADIVVFCSVYEGFGLPIIEGQAMRTPVVTSDRDPMREVAGEGAVLADPDDVASIRSAIIRVIEDEKLRETIVAKGLENVKRFAAGHIAAKYVDLYDTIAGTVKRAI